MQSPDDKTLLRQYAENQSDESFTDLVARHIDFVYSIAMRRVGNASQAEEISQAVFIILAKKAASLRHERALSSWLFQTTRLTTNNFIRGEMRRHRREQEAFMQSQQNETADAVWQQIGPVLDDAVGALGTQDRRAILLRYYEGRSLRDVGTVLGVSEDASEKRVTRALEKLRKFFFKRGLPSATATIAGTISANSVQAAPAGLAKAISVAALAKGVTTSTSTLTLAKGALKVMAWTKAKTAIVAGVGILLAVGTTTVTVKEIQEHRTYPWQREGFDGQVLDKQPPQVRILPSKIKYGAWGNTDNNGVNRLMGTGVSVDRVISAAYDFHSSARTILHAELPPGKYDYIACLPSGNETALQLEARKKLGLVARREMQETNVLLLEVQVSGAPGLKPSRNTGGSSSSDSKGHWTIQNGQLSTLADYLEGTLKTPVIDETGLSNHFDIDLKWNQPNWQNINPDGLRATLLNQLGLQLVPATMPIEMLVVEKAE